MGTTSNVFATPPTAQVLITCHVLTVWSLELSLTSTFVIAAKTPSNVFAASNHHFNLAQTALDQLTPQSLVDNVQDIFKGLVSLSISVNSRVKLTNQVPRGVQWAYVHHLLLPKHSKHGRFVCIRLQHPMLR